MLTHGDRYVQTVIRELDGLHFNTIPLIFPPTHFYLYVCPCIMYENDERYQLDANIYLLL